jgi:N-acetyl-alpha-D-muramate 1-phosphate uridylyltransferase
VTRALCAVVLAAGEGTRLRPLTVEMPKALCPVGNVALLDRALVRLSAHGLSGPALVAVNACYLADQVADHVGGRAYISREPGPPALGTGGALGKLRDWIAGRPVLVGNADAYLAPDGGGVTDLRPLLAGWDGETVRILGIPSPPGQREFGDLRFAGFSLLPAAMVAALPAERSDLVRTVWRPAERAGRLEVIPYEGTYLDTGTPATYLAANLHAAGEGSIVAPDAVVKGQVEHAVIGAGAQILGSVSDSVVLPGGYVGPDERLAGAIRYGRSGTL